MAPKNRKVENVGFIRSQSGYPVQLGRLGLIGERMSETIVPEIDNELKEAAYVDRPEGLVVCGCGDDRTCTHASSQLIEDQFSTPADQAILRYFGGAYGATRAMLVTLAAQYGEKGLADFKGRDFADITAEFGQLAKEKAGIVFAIHSSTGSEEGNEQKLDLQSTKPVGCAYASTLGGVSTGAFSETVINTSMIEAPAIFGKLANNASLTRISEGNRIFLISALGGRPDFSLDRQDYARTKAPVMMLSGDHAANSHTLAVNNLRHDKISNPSAAHNIGRPFYNNDTTQVAEAIIKSYPQYEFDPVTLLLAMDIDIRSTRAALAGGNPAGLELRRYGDAQEAVEYLRSFQAA